MDLDRCQFERSGPDQVRCRQCGATVSTSRPPAQVHRRCAEPLSSAATPRRFRTPAEDARCVHRGALLRVDRCNVCGGGGTPFDVFACAVKGECSLQVRHTKIPHCTVCRDWSDSPPGA